MAILLFPVVTVPPEPIPRNAEPLDVVAAPIESCPIAVLLFPVLILSPVPFPTMTLWSPVVTSWPDSNPMAILLLAPFNGPYNAVYPIPIFASIPAPAHAPPPANAPTNTLS